MVIALSSLPTCSLLLSKQYLVLACGNSLTSLLLEIYFYGKSFLIETCFIDTSLLLVRFQFIFSTAIDGKIKAWLYDNMGSRVDYDAPGHWCTTMLYSADGSR